MELHLDVNDVTFDRKMVRDLLEISEFKGGWEAYGRLPQEQLAILQHMATIESIGSSTRLAGAKLSDADVTRIMTGRSSRSFETQDERDVAGYGLLLKEILTSWEAMPLTENTIEQMHATLLTFSDKASRHRGTDQTGENNAEAFDAAGHPIRSGLEKGNAMETPHCLEQLVTWANRELENKTLPALVVIGMFVVAFLAIRPFPDGNGRLSRALTMLLLLRAGYVYVPYGSLDSMIEASKDCYDMSLRATGKTLDSDRPNWNIWLSFFLKSLVKQGRHLKRKVENERQLRTMPETAMRIIELIRENGPMSITEAAAVLDINKFTLRDRFKRLVQDGVVFRVGKGRATKYALNR